MTLTPEVIAELKPVIILEAILPSRYQRSRKCLRALVSKCWSVSETGLFGFLGDSCDSLETWLRIRAAIRRANEKSHV